MLQELETAPRGTTRDRILDLAEASVLEKGFGATSIDELIAGAGITKSGFFYHFRSKTALAQALLERYIEREDKLFDELFARADELSDDPLHSYLIFLKLLAELLQDLPTGHPGCMVASVCYQEQLFDRRVRDLNGRAVLAWRQRFRQRLDLICERYPPRVAVDLDAMADMVSSLADGGIILSKVVREPMLLPQQILLYRQFVKAVFLGTEAA